MPFGLNSPQVGRDNQVVGMCWGHAIRSQLSFSPQMLVPRWVSTICQKRQYQLAAAQSNSPFAVIGIVSPMKSPGIQPASLARFVCRSHQVGIGKKASLAGRSIVRGRSWKCLIIAGLYSPGATIRACSLFWIVEEGPFPSAGNG